MLLDGNVAIAIAVAAAANRVGVAGRSPWGGLGI